MTVGIRNKIKQFMSDKASRDMQEGNTSSETEGAEEAANDTENQQSQEDLMAEVLEAVKNVDGEEEASDQSEEIQRLKVELAAAHDKYLRTLADMENFKKRSLKERSELMKYQGEQIVLDLLRVSDDLDLALQFSGQDGEEGELADPKKFVEGIKMIHKSFVDTFAKWQIRAESAVGSAFDPQKHMAISRVSIPDTAAGTVVSELKKAYFYKDKILRVAEVIVAAEES